eukprot:m51a1_g4180 hypothetical protein (369) ;mRNA; f:361800-362906
MSEEDAGLLEAARAAGCPDLVPECLSWLPARSSAADRLCSLALSAFGHTRLAASRSLALAALGVDPACVVAALLLRSILVYDPELVVAGKSPSSLYVSVCDAAQPDLARARTFFARATEAHQQPQQRAAAALAGLPPAVLFLAGTFSDFVLQDAEGAVRLWALADARCAPEGFAPAKCSLGLFHEQGHGGLERDVEMAVRLYHDASDMSHANARCNYALCLLRGEGTARNVHEAARLFRDCADRGLARAKCCLANCYLQGQGVPQDRELSVKMYRDAAEGGDPRAMLSLGLFSELGQLGAPRDDVVARRMYECAAAHRDPLAMTRLAVMLLCGKGGEADARRAAVLCRRAIHLGDPQSAVLLRSLQAR